MYYRYISAEIQPKHLNLVCYCS